MILVYNKEVIAVMDTWKQESNGKLVNDCIYPMGDVVEVETPDEIVAYKYCYTKEKGFYLNSNFRDKDAEIEALNKRLAETESAILALMDISMMGGGF